MASGPQRIVCLTAETTEIVFALGLGDRVVGVSGYAVRPPEARRKPRVSAFSTASVDRILALRPDLVLGFSDLQAGIASDLVSAGLAVLITNQRSLEETFAAICMIGGVVGQGTAGQKLSASLQRKLLAVQAGAGLLPRRPRTYFEEWDDPLIAGIGWVSELIELCGGEDIFASLRHAPGASARIVTADRVIAANPEVIVASWCGKKARLEKIAARPGWESLPAVRNGRLHEIKAPDILQPGPSLIHGARQLAAFIRAAAITPGGS